MRPSRAKKSHKNTRSMPPVNVPQSQKADEAPATIDIPLEYSESRPPGSGRKEIDLFLPSADTPAKSATPHLSKAYTTVDKRAFSVTKEPPAFLLEEREARAREREEAAQKTAKQKRPDPEKQKQAVYDYMDGKRHLDIPQAKERPGTASPGLPAARETVVRPEKASAAERDTHRSSNGNSNGSARGKRLSSAQRTSGTGSKKNGNRPPKKKTRTIYEQPKTVTYTDIQTTIPVRNGKGQTYPAAIREEREQRRKRDERLTYLIVACVILFLVAAVWLARIFIGYRMTADEYASVAENYVVMPAAWTTDADLEAEENDFYPALQINFASLFSLNEDFIGWLYVPGPSISYPLVQGDDNEYYLTHTFLDTSSGGGAIFLDFEDRADFSDFNTMIYGHNMQDGSMFGALSRYGSDASLVASYPHFYVYLRNGTVLKYRIFSYYQDTADSDAYLRVDGASAKQQYIDEALAKSVKAPEGGIVTDETITSDASLVTLSTCHGRADSGRRFLVHGYLVGTYHTNQN